MHFTARQIVREYDGKFPETSEKLLKLKGLGEYTAAAIASFAFDEAVPAIDGNVYRVMSRIFGIQSDMLSNDGKKGVCGAWQASWFRRMIRLLITRR
jgi:A/G-specific adenine glycosylase